MWREQAKLAVISFFIIMSKCVSKQRQSWHCTRLNYEKDTGKIWILQIARFLSWSWEAKTILICTCTHRFLALLERFWWKPRLESLFMEFMDYRGTWTKILAENLGGPPSQVEQTKGKEKGHREGNVSLYVPTITTMMCVLFSVSFLLLFLADFQSREDNHCQG